MVGRHGTLLTVTGKIATVDIVENLLVRPMLQDKPCPARLVTVVRNSDKSAQQRRDICDTGQASRKLYCDLTPVVLAAQLSLRQTYQCDHSPVSFARAVAESKDSTLVQSQLFILQYTLAHLLPLLRART